MLLSTSYSDLYNFNTPSPANGKLQWFISLQWRHNGYDCVSNHQPCNCLFNWFFRHRSKKTSKLRATGLCEGNSPVTGEFPAQRASNAENVSIWWRLHGTCTCTSPHIARQAGSLPYAPMGSLHTHLVKMVATSPKDCDSPNRVPVKMLWKFTMCSPC